MSPNFFHFSAPPDRGLVTQQMSGKKKEKFCISIGLACNADGSKRLEPFFISKAKKPRCFKKQTPEQWGFYYRNNKKAWMTAVIFEEYVDMMLWLLLISNQWPGWIKKLNLQMKQQNSTFACLLIISLPTASRINHQTLILNILGPTWHHLSNHVMLESSDASRHYITIIFAHALLILMKLANGIFIKLIFLKAWQWRSKHGMLSHLKPSNIVGITLTFKCKSSFNLVFLELKSITVIQQLTLTHGLTWIQLHGTLSTNSQLPKFPFPMQRTSYRLFLASAT